MSIFLDKNSKVIVQGITGAEGSYHTDRMIKYGTNIVGGVTPGKGGQKSSHGLPVFNTVKDAVDATGATHTCIFVPPPFAADALFEAHDAGIALRGLHHRGRPGQRRAQGRRDDRRHADHRPELPRAHLAGQSLGRHHAGPHLQGGQRRPDLAVRHADL